MAGYRFEFAASACGPKAIEALDGELGRPRITAIARKDFGSACTSARAWCERWAEQLGDAPDTIAVEVYEVFADGEPRFTLYYTPWSDSGNLFFAGSARKAKLALWPDGFRPTGPDADALSRAFRVAVAELAAKKKRSSKKRK